MLYELYARSANIAGDSVRAKEAIAESYYLRGSIHEAAMQLQALANAEDLDYYQRARITARITELRMELAKLGVPEKNIHVSLERSMKCGCGFCGHCQCGPHFVCKDGPVFDYPTVKKLMSIREI